MGQEQSYREALHYLYSLQKFGIKLGLSNTLNLLESLGNPHHGRRYVHIAGTNGKGSVAVFLASILQRAGLRVGVYTSPHLVRFTERFRINGREISPEEVVHLTRQIRQVICSDPPPTFFEVTTAMALLHFTQQETDIAIMEVGMGGRLDATNVIRPMVSVITNIGMEHREYLGQRLLDIAAEKGGIIKEGVPLLTGARQAEVIRLLEELCRQKRAPLRRLGKEIRYRADRNGVRYWGLRRRLSCLSLGLAGGVQPRNAALALAAAEVLEEMGVILSEQAIREGLAEASWPGRLQVMGTSPILVLDGAHNPPAMKALARVIGQEFQYDQLILVIGVMKDKDIRGILSRIVPLAGHVIYSRPVYPRAAEPEDLWEMGKAYHGSAEVTASVSEAIERARRLAGPRDLVLVTGSLFVVGEALSHLDPVSFRPDEEV